MPCKRRHCLYSSRASQKAKMAEPEATRMYPRVEGLVPECGGAWPVWSAMRYSGRLASAAMDIPLIRQLRASKREGSRLMICAARRTVAVKSEVDHRWCGCDVGRGAPEEK